MLDDTRVPDAGEGEFVRFSETGAWAAGAFRCADCGYGVTVHVQLPRCPMCGGMSWEAEPVTPRSPIVRQLL